MKKVTKKRYTSFSDAGEAAEKKKSDRNRQNSECKRKKRVIRRGTEEMA